MGYIYCNTPEKSDLKALQAQYDSIMEVNSKLDLQLDSIRLEIKYSDTIIIHTKETTYVKVKDVLNLNADSSIRLFNSWTRQLQDSLDKKRHVLNLPNFSN